MNASHVKVGAWYKTRKIEDPWGRGSCYYVRVLEKCESHAGYFETEKAKAKYRGWLKVADVLSGRTYEIQARDLICEAPDPDA